MPMEMHWAYSGQIFGENEPSRLASSSAEALSLEKVPSSTAQVESSHKSLILDFESSSQRSSVLQLKCITDFGPMCVTNGIPFPHYHIVFEIECNNYWD
jgi:hypothetical protein